MITWRRRRKITTDADDNYYELYERVNLNFEEQVIMSDFERVGAEDHNSNLKSVNTQTNFNQTNTQINQSPSINTRCRKENRCNFRRYRKISTVILLAWLIMNTDPTYSLRTVRQMIASRLLNRSLLRPWRASTNNPPANSNSNGLSIVEAIAIIQALNGNNRNNQLMDVQTLLANQLANSNPSVARQALALQDANTRQLPVPAPPRTIIEAIVAAAVTAFFTAVAAGRPPIIAFAAAVAAAAFAFFVAIVVILAEKRKTKSSPLIKKLVIKKTVLPFFIPIPIKKEEKKIIYKYVKKPHHKEHGHDEHESKINYKFKKSTEIPPLDKEDPTAPIDQIEGLLNEQDRIQMILEKLVEEKEQVSAKNTKSRYGGDGAKAKSSRYNRLSNTIE